MSEDFDYQDDYDANVWPKEDCDCGHRRYQHKSGTGTCLAGNVDRLGSVGDTCRCTQFSDPEPYSDGM